MDELDPLIERVRNALQTEKKELTKSEVLQLLQLGDDNQDDQDKYRQVINRMAMTDIAVPLRGRNGGLRLTVKNPAPLDPPTIKDIEDARLQDEQFETQINENEKKEKQREVKFYPYLETWAINQGHNFVYTVADKHRREQWRSPDLLAIDVNELRWIAGREVEVTSVEAKLSFSLRAIWQAATYRQFSHYVYLACFESPDEIRTRDEGRLFEIAVELGLGIIAMRRAGAGANGVACQEINSPRRQAPAVYEIDELLQDYREVLKLEPIGRVLARQLEQLP